MKATFQKMLRDHPLSWRRVVIEKAATNVKKALESKANLQAPYKKGELVFDEEAHKLAVL